MGAYARRNAAIATSVGALVVAFLLIIFFGAWAVSASSEGDVTSVLAGAAAGFSGSISPLSQRNPLRQVPPPIPTTSHAWRLARPPEAYRRRYLVGQGVLGRVSAPLNVSERIRREAIP